MAERGKDHRKRTVVSVGSSAWLGSFFSTSGEQLRLPEPPTKKDEHQDDLHDPPNSQSEIDSDNANYSPSRVKKGQR
jgi:hypothetical protein